METLGIRKIAGALISLAMLMAVQSARGQETTGRELLLKSKRIVFLGDSITAAGQYVAAFDTWLAIEMKDKAPKLIDCGLPSETVSGLSENGHAGGKFPRPDLAERLDRVLGLTKPDLVIACYGINCGIYLPFDESRFEKYQQGMQRLKSAVEKAGAKFVVMTPPFYDDQRSPRDFSYNEVLDRYSDWLIGQRKEGWTVIDLHGPMTKAIHERRVSDPQFTMQPDGVHPNDAGHWFVAQQLVSWAGDENSAAANSPKSMLTARQVPDEVFTLCQQRMGLLRDAYVGEAGHLRPGVAKGLSVPEAESRAAQLTVKITNLVADSAK